MISFRHGSELVSIQRKRIIFEAITQSEINFLNKKVILNELLTLASKDLKKKFLILRYL